MNEADEMKGTFSFTTAAPRTVRSQVKSTPESR